MITAIITHGSCDGGGSISPTGAIILGSVIFLGFVAVALCGWFGMRAVLGEDDREAAENPVYLGPVMLGTPWYDTGDDLHHGRLNGDN